MSRFLPFIYFNETATPKCFYSRAQFLFWKHSKGSKDDLKKNGYCCDCLPEYRDRMIAAGRCEHPGVQFVISGDGFLDGVRNLRPHSGKTVYNDTPSAMRDLYAIEEQRRGRRGAR